jgi:cytochrome P450
VLSDEDRSRLRAGNLLMLDPPAHQRLRRMVATEFTVRRIKRLESRIAAIVVEHLDAMEAHGSPIDLVTAFALPIPSLVICELLGVPYADHEEFQHRSARQLDMTIPVSERLELVRQSREYMSSLVARARKTPGDDILGMLIREHDEALSDHELVGIASMLLVAGHETTAHMLSLGTLALLRHPDQATALRAGRYAVGPAIEELLRWLSIAHSGIPRLTTTDVELASVPIPAGELVVVSLASANRDPHLIDFPDHLDVGRGTSGHVAFGHGVHHCLGAPLARIELSIALPALLRRFPTLTLAEPFREVRFRSLHFVFGVQSLLVSW